MKGLSIEYIAFIILFLLVIVIGIGIINNLYKKTPPPENNIVYNVTYKCILLNDTSINFDDFRDILYGFTTDQCNNFQAELTEKITFEDIVRIINNWSLSTPVIKMEECKLPNTNSHNIYVNFNSGEIKPNSKVYLKRREIKNSDILICEII